MPDSIRPTSSMFSKLVKSIFSFDGSVRRIITSPGAKNFSTAYTYVSSLAFDLLMRAKNNKGKTGKQILLYSSREWITPREFAKKMNWVGDDGEPTQYTILYLNDLFLSFCQDKAMKMERIEGSYKFKFINYLEFPDNEEIDLVRKTNSMFMSAIDEFMQYMVPSLKAGKPLVDRYETSNAIVWEAFLGDPMINSFRNEYVLQIFKRLVKLSTKEKIRIVEFGTGVGKGIVSLVDKIMKKFTNTEFEIYCFDEMPMLLKRAESHITYYLSTVATELSNRNITINVYYKIYNGNKNISLDGTFDIVGSFLNIQYIRETQRTEYFGIISQLLNDDGTLVIGQPTSYSKEFPYPLTLVFRVTSKFEFYPTPKEMNEYLTSFFGKIKSVGLDFYWIVQKPKNK